jgi:NAD(P)-dependent dehydrogenase (short-subunit alcohol dehydrogenase family)
MAIQIKNSIALVTGANRGIGRAIVDALITQGAAKVYAAARDTSSLAALVAAHPGRVVALELDVTNEAQLAAAVAQAKDVQLLINNAGVAKAVGGELADEKWIAAGTEEMRVNVFGTLAVSQAFAPTLKANGGGAIANLISVAGLVNMPLFFSYSASKAALHSITQGLRLLLGSQGTLVSGVYPGPVDTDMASEVPFDKTSPADVAKAILAGIDAGTEDIYPDAMAQQMGAAYAKDPKSLEAIVASLAA